MSACVRARVSACVRACMLACAPACDCVPVCIPAYRRACVCACVRACVRAGGRAGMQVGGWVGVHERMPMATCVCLSAESSKRSSVDSCAKQQAVSSSACSSAGNDPAHWSRTLRTYVHTCLHTHTPVHAFVAHTATSALEVSGVSSITVEPGSIDTVNSSPLTAR